MSTCERNDLTVEFEVFEADHTCRIESYEFIQRGGAHLERFVFMRMRTAQTHVFRCLACLPRCKAQATCTPTPQRRSAILNCGRSVVVKEKRSLLLLLHGIWLSHACAEAEFVNEPTNEDENCDKGDGEVRT